jgi:hypothetical protein
MERRFEERASWSALNERSGEKYTRPVGQMTHDGEIVANEQNCDSGLASQTSKQVDDAGLHRNI